MEPGLLGVDLVRVVVEVLPAEEEPELGIVPLKCKLTDLILVCTNTPSLFSSAYSDILGLSLLGLSLKPLRLKVSLTVHNIFDCT